MELESLVGARRLDAVDFENEKIKELYGDGFEDSSVCRFRLDGIVYVAIEDPSDGYRSNMRDIVVANDVRMVNEFPAVEVVGRMRTRSEYGDVDDVLELVDAYTDRVVLEVGTGNTDDYYPYFVASFHPEAMATNADIEAKARKDAEGWIQWAGGECPVDVDTLVQIQAGFSPDQSPSPAGNWMWDHDRPLRDCIIAYRVVSA